MRHPERLPVFVLFREFPGRNWQVIAIGPMDALVEMSRDGDEVHPVGSVPPNYRGP